MKSTTFVLLQTLALGALAAPAPKDTPKFDFHKGLTREQEGREFNTSTSRILVETNVLTLC